MGYGSLINLESASKTLRRKITKNDVRTGLLHGFERSWTLWDNVFSMDLEKQVKGVFLNIMPKEGAFLNGTLLTISNSELEFLKVREKNYECVEVTKEITLHNQSDSHLSVFTFLGKKEHLVGDDADNYFIFERYLELVNLGILEFGELFSSVFNNTTRASSLPRLPGLYTFVDTSQENAR